MRGSRSFGGKKILSPEDAGLLSAYGVGLSRIERVIEKLFQLALIMRGLRNLKRNWLRTEEENFQFSKMILS